MRIAPQTHRREQQESGHVEDMLIDARTLTTIGMAMTERVTNSVKHAFAGNKSGHISVVVTRRDSRIALTCRDNGAGLDALAPGTGGIGMQLVNILFENLDGALRIHPEQGLRIELEFPDPSLNALYAPKPLQPPEHGSYRAAFRLRRHESLWFVGSTFSTSLIMSKGDT